MNMLETMELFGTLLIAAVILTLVITIVLAIAVVPDKKRSKLKGFGRFLNDIFNFRGLLIESITRFFYILTTVAFVVFGFFMLFLVVEQKSFFDDSVRTVWYGWIGLILMVVGPIVTRLIFEAAMLFILLVKNVIKINNKLDDILAKKEYCNKTEKEKSFVNHARVDVKEVPAEVVTPKVVPVAAEETIAPKEEAQE